MNDPMSRQAAINALEAQERQHAAQKRRYAFGNDEFSLEAAYHDCKLVFDGITDDDSFQEADTGLILYYANEIIYALHEALEKDTNILSNDCISRQAAIDVLDDEIAKTGINKSYTVKDYAKRVKRKLKKLPSAQPEIIRCEDCKHYLCPHGCGHIDGMVTSQKDGFCSHAERREE